MPLLTPALHSFVSCKPTILNIVIVTQLKRAIYQMTFADKTALGQSAVLGIMYSLILLTPLRPNLPLA